MNFLSKENKMAILIGVLSFFFAWFYNEWNLSILKKEAPQKVNSHNTIRTPDDASYLTPAKTFYETGVWKTGGIGKQVYFFRTPGYGFYRLSLMYLVGYNSSYVLAKFLQLLLFAISCLWLYKIAFYFTNNQKLALCLSLIYGCAPFACSFLYFNITESITPAILILYYFLLIKSQKEEKKLFYYFLSAVCISLLILIRPVLGIFLFLLPYLFLNDFYKKGKRVASLLILSLLLFVSLAGIGAWALRSYSIAGKWVGLQPQFLVDNNSAFRPSHKAILDFSLSFGMNITDFDVAILPLWNAAIKGDTATLYAENYIKIIPTNVLRTIGRDTLLQALKKHQLAILWQKNYYDKNLPMPDTIPFQEQKVITDFTRFTQTYQSNYFFESQILVPLRILKKFVFHSNLSLHIFQKTYRGNVLVEAMRWLFFFLHLSCFVALFLTAFLLPKWKEKMLFSLVVLVYLFYLVSLHRLFEERYTLPLLPLMMVGLGIIIGKLFKNKTNI